MFSLFLVTALTTDKLYRTYKELKQNSFVIINNSFFFDASMFSLYRTYKDLMGYFVPDRYQISSTTLLNQCIVYNTQELRLKLARQMELAGIHNMRANLRYYKKIDGQLSESIQTLSSIIVEVNEGKSVDELMLMEARAKQVYYAAFNRIIKNIDFRFEKRTKRPPEDALNAMISFGNTLLYNQFLQIIWKTSLEPRVGIVHAANRRQYSLNLDFADIFKPVVVDRVIFSLINRGQIKKDEHFQKEDNGGIYLNREGKKLFIEAFENKMATKIVVKGKQLAYRQLMIQEGKNFQQFILEKEEYRPYKYY